jgi:hypothetical protein
MPRCPDCANGTTRIACTVNGHRESRNHRCQRCKGAGSIPQEMREWIRLGAAMRERRLGENRTLREEARRRCMLPQQLSAMELGLIKPVEGEEATT